MSTDPATYPPGTKEFVIDVITDSFKLTNSLLNESERAAVILAAARLDVDLEKLLRQLLVPHPGGNDPLFDGDRMLGTFSAKILFAYRLGAIDPGFEHALQILRRIRNDFAHGLDDETLSSNRQKQRVHQLVRWAEHSKVYQSAISAHGERAKSVEHLQFTACAVCMAMLLQISWKKFSQITIRDPMSISDT